MSRHGENDYDRLFQDLIDLRSLIPSKLHVMAFTATVAIMSYHIIGERLSLYDTILISASPVRNNIVYVIAPKIETEHFCTTLAMS